MLETVSQTLDRLNVHYNSFLEIIAASGQVDMNLHTLLASTLDSRLIGNTWDYQLHPQTLLQLIENEITRFHGIVLSNTESGLAADLQRLKEYYNAVLKNGLCRSWLQRHDKTSSRQIMILGRTALADAAPYEVMLAKILAYIAPEKRLTTIKNGPFYQEYCSREDEYYQDEEGDEIEELMDDFSGNIDLLLNSTQNPAALRLILEYYPEQERPEVIAYKNYALLHSAAGNLDSLNLLLNYFPPAERLQIIKNREGTSIHYGRNRHNREREIKPLLYQAIANVRTLVALLSLFPEQERQTVIKDSGVLYAAAANPSALELLLNWIPELERLVVISKTSGYHNRSEILERAADYPEAIKVIFKLLPESQHLAVVKAILSYGISERRHPAANKDYLELLLNKYPSHERLQVIKNTINEGQNLLHIAAEYDAAALRLILDLYPSEERLAVIDKADRSGRTALHKALNNIDSLKLLLSLYTLQEQEQAIHKIFAEKRLFRCSDAHHALILLLEQLPETERFAALQYTDEQGNTLLFDYRYYPEVCEGILNLISETDRFTLIQQTNKDNKTVLHYLVDNPKRFAAILKFAPEEQRLALIKNTHNKDEIVLWCARYSNDNIDLADLIAILPQAERFDALQIAVNEYGEAMLYNIAYKPKVLAIILKLLTADQLAKIFTLINDKGDTVLGAATRSANPATIQLFLELLPETERLKALMHLAKDEKGTILQRNISHPACFIAILKLLPKTERLTAFMQEDSYGTTALSEAAYYYPMFVKGLLRLIPAECRLEVLNSMNVLPRLIASKSEDVSPYTIAGVMSLLPELDRLTAILPTTKASKSVKARKTVKAGKTILEQAYERAGFVNALLSQLPQTAQLAAVTQIAFDIPTQLHKVIYEPDTLAMLLELIPSPNRVNAVFAKNAAGLTLLEAACSKQDSLETLIEQLPDVHRLQALTLRTKDNTLLIHRLASDPTTLVYVVNLLPLEQRLNALSLTNKDDDTILHLIAHKRFAIERLLAAVPMDERLQAMKRPGKAGNTILHKVVNDDAALRSLLNNYPSEQRFSELNRANDHGETLFSLAIHSFTKLQLLLQALPVADKLQAIMMFNQTNDSPLLKLNQFFINHILPGLPGGRLILTMLDKLVLNAKLETMISWLSNIELLHSMTIVYFTTETDSSKLAELYEDFINEHSLFNNSSSSFNQCAQTLQSLLTTKSQTMNRYQTLASIGLFSPTAPKRNRSELDNLQLEAERLDNKMNQQRTLSNTNATLQADITGHLKSKLHHIQDQLQEAEHEQQEQEGVNPLAFQ